MISNSVAPLSVAVVTGGHPFDTKEFHRLFRSLPGVDAYVQHLDDWVCASSEVRASHDVVVFYNMTMTGPLDEGLPWFSGRQLQALSELGDTMDEPGGRDVELLLTTRHEPSMRANAWTNRHKNCRVFCYQSGHGAAVYADPNFRTVLVRGIHWVSRNSQG